MDLCFPLSGVIQYRADNAKLGKQDIDGFDLSSLILDHLDKTTGTGPTTRLIYTSAKLREFLLPRSLFMLRNDRLAVELDIAIHRRNIAFLEKYAHIATLASQQPADVDAWKQRHESKWQNLKDLRSHAVKRHDELVAMATADGETGPRAPESDSFYFDKLAGKPAPASPEPIRAQPVSTTKSRPVGMFHSETVMQVTNDQRSQTTGGAAGKGEALHTNVTKPTYTFPTLVPGGFDFPVHVPLFDLFDSQINYTEHYTQRTRRHDGDYRHPYEEEFMRFHREIAALEQELVDTFTFNQRLPYLAEIWQAEFGSIQQEVRRAQIAYVDTFIIPPPTEPRVVSINVAPEIPNQRDVTSGTSGVVTVVHKDAGEFVQAGEPVVRVENAHKALLAGVLVYRDRLAVAQQVRLDFRGLFEEPTTAELPAAPTAPPPHSGRLLGEIVTIRGHNADNDLWDVVIECAAWDTSLLPINYTFESTPDRYGEPGAELQGAVIEIL